MKWKGKIMQNLRQSKKGFSVKIYVFATVTLLFHLKHHKALVYSTRDFPVLPSHPQRTVVTMKAMTAAVNLCLESWYCHIHSLGGKWLLLEYTPQEQSGGPAPPGHLGSVPDGRERVQRGAHVQDGELVVLVHRSAIIVINDVAHLLPTAVHYPVVPVKGQLVPAQDREQATGVF